MIETDIVYNDIKLRLICHKDFLLMIKCLLQGHVDFLEPTGIAEYTLHISDERIIRPGLYEKIIDKWFNYATADCYINNDEKICYLNNICADSLENKTLLIQYFTGNVLNRLLEMRGFIGLHSSCVEKDGNGILFVAGRNRGKTVCMLNMLNNNYNIVTNDKSAINYCDNKIIDYGVAQSISIRMSKEFRSRNENRKYVEIAKLQGKLLCDENLLEGNNILLTDTELSQINNVKVSKDAVLNILFCPSYNTSLIHPIFKKMTKEDIRKIVSEQLLTLVHDTTSFLYNMHSSHEKVPDFDNIIERLCEIPSYYVEQNENTTDEFVEKVIQLSLK